MYRSVSGLQVAAGKCDLRRRQGRLVKPGFGLTCIIRRHHPALRTPTTFNQRYLATTLCSSSECDETSHGSPRYIIVINLSYRAPQLLPATWLSLEELSWVLGEAASWASRYFVPPKDTILNLALPLHLLKFSVKEKVLNNMESATINDIHVVGVDGTGEQVLNGMYKEMTIDRLKRTVTILNRKPASTWESLQLYHLGNEMHNGESKSCMIAPKVLY